MNHRANDAGILNQAGESEYSGDPRYHCQPAWHIPEVNRSPFSIVKGGNCKADGVVFDVFEVKQFLNLQATSLKISISFSRLSTQLKASKRNQMKMGKFHWMSSDKTAANIKATIRDQTVLSVTPEQFTADRRPGGGNDFHGQS